MQLIGVTTLLLSFIGMVIFCVIEIKLKTRVKKLSVLRILVSNYSQTRFSG